MRLFIALQLNDKQLTDLNNIVGQLTPYLTGGNVVSKDNYHITLQFLGDIAEDRLIYIISALDSLASMATPTLSFSNMAGFSNSSIVYARVKTDDNLQQLHCQLCLLLEQGGMLVEQRAYRPHVTLVRNAKFCLPFSEIVKRVDVYNKQFECNTVTLYASDSDGNQSVYSPLYSVRLMD